MHISRMIEALTDSKTWLFTLFLALGSIPGSLANQQTLIVASFGFTILQTTLLSSVTGVIEILTVFTAIRLAVRRPNSRAYVGAVYFVPSWLGILLVNLLPWSNKVCAITPLANLVVLNIARDIRLDFLSACTCVRVELLNVCMLIVP